MTFWGGQGRVQFNIIILPLFHNYDPERVIYYGVIFFLGVLTIFRKGLFILAHQCGDTSFYPTYKKLLKNQWNTYEELKLEQDKKLRVLIEFAYENVPYYHKLFKNLALSPGNINTTEDLEKLPILTKDTIKKNWEDFKPINLSKMKYYPRATSGSTGTPLQYRISKYDRFFGGALLYRGWGYEDYELGDKMVFLAGSSLDIGTQSRMNTKIHEIARNIRKLSSFDMGEQEMDKYAGVLNSFKPRFIQAYALSIYFFAQWLEKNQVSVPSPDGVITTAEKLYPHMRKTLEDVFGCEVYDTYGLNDGGVSAYECKEHVGMHIDTERSIMEVVDGEGHVVKEGEGQILATSLHNYAMPFIRYATCDYGVLLDDPCPCGRAYPLLKEVIGRTTDVLLTPEGKNIHGFFFSTIFMNCNKGIKEYQVVQKTLDKIIINIVPEDGFNEDWLEEEQLEHIKAIIHKRSPNWDIEFKFVDQIKRTKAGKYKFIINEVNL